MPENRPDLPQPGSNQEQHIDRERLGGTSRSTERDRRREENRAPSSAAEISQGPEVISRDTGPRVNWVVFLSAAVAISAFSAWAMVLPDTAREVVHSVVLWIARNLGWFYVLTVAVGIGFVIWVALSNEGRVRLGPDHSRPEYSFFTWLSMLFYSVTGPITQYVHPISAEPESLAAAEESVVWTMFHYGVAGWSMYALLGTVFGVAT